MSGIHRRLGREMVRLETDRETLLARLSELDDERIRTPPEPGVWSVAQIVEHLVQAEHHMLLGKLSIRELQRRPRSIRNRLYFQLVILVLSSPIPVKTPGDAVGPTGTVPLDELAARWRASQSRFRQVVLGEGAAKEIDPLRDAVFRHPLAGPMTPAQAVQMIGTHQRRHLKQIQERLGS